MEQKMQDDEFIAGLDPKVEEHARLFQQVQSRKREAEIKRRAEERKWYPKQSDNSFFSESDWARRKAELDNKRRREFPRQQKKMEAEIRMGSGRKRLSRETIFVYHERLWNRIALPGDEIFRVIFHGLWKRFRGVQRKYRSISSEHICRALFGQIKMGEVSEEPHQG